MSKDLTGHDSFELVPADENGARDALASPPEYPAAGMDPLEEEAGGANLRRYLAAVLRYKWIILVFTIAGTAAGFGAAQLVEPQYAARATLWIETGSPQGDERGPIRPDELLESSSSWIELLRSGLVLDHVVQAQRLFVQPRVAADSVLLKSLEFRDSFVPSTYRIRTDPASRTFVLETSAGIIERGTFGDSVGEQLGFLWAPPLERIPAGRPMEFEILSPRQVSNELGERLGSEIDRNGNFLQLTLTGSDPQRVAATLNQITDRYIEVAADLKRGRLDELVGILNEQLDYSQQRLRDAEIALEDFRVQTITLPSERSTPVSPGLEMTRDPVFQNFFEMRVELEQIRRDRDVIRRVITSGAAESLDVLGTVAAVRESPEMQAALQEVVRKRGELRALRYRYTDEHPPVAQLIREIETLETRTIPGIAQRVLGELSAREAQLEERLASASSELEQIPPRAIEEARLTRSVESADNLYTNLLRRFDEARLAAASSIPDVRVLDRALVPQEPTQDQKPQLILLAFLGSLGLGILGAILRDRFDPRLRYPDQVTDEMGLPILTGVPNLRSRRAFFGRDNTDQAQEAFRSLRLGVMHAYGAAGSLTVTITSPGPGDGKSFVSANLGQAFAHIGKRTLVIDGDTRRGRLHDMLGGERKPGLTDLLRQGPQSGLDTIRATEHENLFVMPSGRRMQQGPELLSSRTMRDLMMRLRSEFDVIIMDSPPLGAGVDPFVLGTLTGSMLVVLRTGETDRELADAKLELLERLPIRLLGAVLNGVPATREYRYYSYTSGYEARDEEETRAPELVSG